MRKTEIISLLFLTLSAGAMLSGCSHAGETVDAAVVSALEEQETQDVAEAVQKMQLAESSRAQVIADSIAESVSQYEASVAESSRQVDEAIAAAQQAAVEASIAESAAVHQSYLQQLIAGTTLVPGGIVPVDDSAIPVFQRLFQNTRVIGDSRAKGVIWSGVLNEAEVFCDVGVHAAHLGNTAVAAAYTYPSKALFFMGVNDCLVYGDNLEQFVADYQQAIASFLAIDPGCHIYVMAAIGCTDAAIAKQPGLANMPVISQAIANMCVANGYTYVNIDNYLTEDMYSEDGIHFQKSFYLLWAQDMANKLGLWEDANP